MAVAPIEAADRGRPIRIGFPRRVGMETERMPSAKRPEPPGAERLAGLLARIAGGGTVARRRPRPELAGLEGATEPAREARRSRARIGRSRAGLDSRGRRDLADQLEPRRDSVAGRIAPEDGDDSFVPAFDDSPGERRPVYRDIAGPVRAPPIGRPETPRGVKQSAGRAGGRSRLSSSVASVPRRFGGRFATGGWRKRDGTRRNAGPGTRARQARLEAPAAPSSFNPGSREP